MILVLALSACTGSGAEAVEGEPAVIISPIEGTDLSRLTLSGRAAERLGIETVPVAEREVDGVPRLVIPYAAVLYDADGAIWTYTNPEELVFIRARLEVERISGSDAILIDGPETGMPVVSVGGAELWGAEHGVGGGH